MKTSDLIKKSHARRGKPGTLKAKIDGPITKAKVLALKNRPGATTLDKKQANFYLNMHEEAPPATSIGNQSVALPPTAKFKPKVVVDRRRRKDKHPVLLKRFRKYMEDNNG